MENRTLNYNDTAFKVLHPLLEKVFCPPATSAPVERIFSHSGLLMRETGLECVTTCCHSWSSLGPRAAAVSRRRVHKP